MDNAAGNALIFKGGQVEVSRTLVKIGKKSFPIASISSVEVTEGDKKKELWQGTLGFLFITGLLFATTGNSYWSAGAAVITFLSVIASLFAKKEKLMLRTAGGEIQAMTGKQAEVEAVKLALEEAFASR